jgi:transposase
VLENDNIALQNTIKEQGNSIKEKEALIAKLTRMLFGQKRERFEAVSVIQLAIEFGGIFSTEELQKFEEAINTKKETVKQKEAIEAKKPHPGRKPLPKHLSIVEVVITPTEDVSDMVLVGKEESDSLEYEPAKFYIQRIVRPKYAPKTKEGSFVIAKMPESNFPKCIAGTSLIAQILVDKYVDHLPLYRQLQRFKREEIDVNASTIDNWVKLGIGRLDILYEYQQKRLIHQKYLQVDETTLKVLDSNKKGAAHLGYFWVYNDPLGDNAFFKYEIGRAAKYPQLVLDNFTGYLQTDGYGGYNDLAKRETITHVACWAHVRRKFEESLSNDQALAETAMILIQGLYQIEREAREQNLSPAARKELRLENSLPLYNLLGKWIGQQLGDTLPKSSIGKAMRYAQERWDELGNYMLDGNLEIDNNLVENAIRPVALGRKNYLFAGSHDAAQRSAVIYTFMSQCKKHDINPQKWLKYVFENILDTKPSQYETLLPAYMKNNPIF